MKFMYSLPILLLLGALVTAVAGTRCNGLNDLCDLRIDQATFPGTHNSGSGFDGLLYYGGGGVAGSCFYRNQGHSFTEQLEFGIRYFDINTCWRNNEAVNCHCGSSHICAYAGSVSKALLQVNAWLTNNQNEVVIIHFNRHVQESYTSEIARHLESTLIALWDPNSGGDIVMNMYYSVHSAWPTLRQAITDRQRVFVFMDSKLRQFLSSNYNWAYQSNDFIASSWGPNYLSSSCSTITANARSKCTSQLDFMELSAVGTAGLCIWDMATVCSKWLGEAQDACLERRSSRGKTVNFLLVDWIDYYHGEESVVNKAKFMNEKNIKRYLNHDIYFPELAGCSYHAGWFYNYCWRYCPTYGWCWVNEYCGRNANICQQSELSCYSSCGY